LSCYWLLANDPLLTQTINCYCWRTVDWYYWPIDCVIEPSPGSWRLLVLLLLVLCGVSYWLTQTQAIVGQLTSWLTQYYCYYYCEPNDPGQWTAQLIIGDWRAQLLVLLDSYYYWLLYYWILTQLLLIDCCWLLVLLVIVDCYCCWLVFIVLIGIVDCCCYCYCYCYCYWWYLLIILLVVDIIEPIYWPNDGQLLKLLYWTVGPNWQLLDPVVDNYCIIIIGQWLIVESNDGLDGGWQAGTDVSQPDWPSGPIVIVSCGWQWPGQTDPDELVIDEQPSKLTQWWTGPDDPVTDWPRRTNCGQ